MRFEVLPAIDLRGGRVVRLVEGDFGRETSYDADPVTVALEFAAAGVRALHVVDLDGAREGRPAQLALVEAVVAAVNPGCAVEIGGGLRTARDVEAALETGSRRVVLGTAAIRESGFAAKLVARHGAERVAVALDVRAGLALGEGWRDASSGVDAAEALHRLADEGLTTFEVTAIDRDGRLEGPDLDLLNRLASLERADIIASGGIRSIDDLRATRDLGCAGAIVGRALYEGGLDLAAAVKELSNGE
jgi:phosphoribosylformimino-5-aminoimidazole carboxamide ribotide isomerase